MAAFRSAIADNQATPITKDRKMKRILLLTALAATLGFNGCASTPRAYDLKLSLDPSVETPVDRYARECLTTKAESEQTDRPDVG